MVQEEVRARSRKEWRGWLRAHHKTASGIWLIFAKKASGLPTVRYSEAVEEALCFGWIDGLMRPIDATFHKQYFAPRKPTSAWARSNKERVARLIQQGSMTRAGIAAIEAAKANGSWDRLTAAESLSMPPELRKALSANARAKKHWPQFTESQRKQFLFWLATARREETRARRIAAIVAMAAKKMAPAMAAQAARAVTAKRRRAEP